MVGSREGKVWVFHVWDLAGWSKGLEKSGWGKLFSSCGKCYYFSENFLPWWKAAFPKWMEKSVWFPGKINLMAEKHFRVKPGLQAGQSSPSCGTPPPPLSTLLTAKLLPPLCIWEGRMKWRPGWKTPCASVSAYARERACTFPRARTPTAQRCPPLRPRPVFPPSYYCHRRSYKWSCLQQQSHECNK